MNRPVALVLAGVVSLIGAVAVPVVGLSVAQWDTDYVYTVDEGGYCSDVLRDPPGVDQSTDYRVDYANLSETGRRHFERALEDGRYVVDDEADAAPDFEFATDHVAPGKGCYAVSYEGEAHALGTNRESELVGFASGPWLGLIGYALAVLGVGSLLAGVQLAATRKRLQD